MTTFQRLRTEDRTGQLMSPEELCLNLGATPALADHIPVLSSIFLNENVDSCHNRISPSGEMSTPASEIVVKVEDVDMDDNACTPAPDILERAT